MAKSKIKNQSENDTDAKNKEKREILDELIIVKGKIARNLKGEIPEIYEIFINSPEYEVELELPLSILSAIKNKYEFEFKEGKEIFIKIAGELFKEDEAIFLGKCTVHGVQKDKFTGSIGGLRFKLINLTEDIKVFPQNVEIFVGLFKTFEELTRSGT